MVVILREWNGEWKNGWSIGRKNEWMDGWMNEWMNEWMHVQGFMSQLTPIIILGVASYVKYEP